MIALVLVMLAQAATAGPATSAKEGVPTKPKMICRRYDVIGSLVRKQKVCRTARAWSRVEDDAQAEANRQIPHITTERGN